MENKNAVVTGGNRGIGLSIVKTLAENNFNIAVVGTTAPSDDDYNEIVLNGVKCEYFKLNISNFDECKTTMKLIKESFGTIDVLVNNAGITADDVIIRMSEEDFDRVIDINLKGAFNMIRHTAPIMMKQKSGNIINISSIIGVIGNMGQINYAASKAGVIGMTKSAAKELGGKGIVVNAVAPGFIRTKMTKVLSDEVKKSYLDTIPLKRFGDPIEVAELVVFLAKQSYITGQVINIDGGIV